MGSSMISIDDLKLRNGRLSVYNVTVSNIYDYPSLTSKMTVKISLNSSNHHDTILDLVKKEHGDQAKIKTVAEKRQQAGSFEFGIGSSYGPGDR